MKKVFLLLICVLMLMSIMLSPATLAKKSAKKVEITFWDMVWGPAEYVETAKALVKKFNRGSSTINVKYQSVPWDNWYQTFSVAIAAGNAPDVSTGAGYQQHQFAEMGEILPLDSIVKKWKREGKLKDFSPVLLSQFQYKGVQIGIPWNVDPRGIYYRKDLLKKAALSVPTDWDEFYTAVKKMTTKDVYGIVFPSLTSFGHWTFLNLMFNNGGHIVDENMKADLANPKNIEALDLLRRFKNEKLCPEGVGGYSGAEAEKIFMQGKAAMIIVPPDFAPQIQAQSKKFSDNVEVLPVLRNKEGKRCMPCGINALMAYKQTKHPEEAKQFLEWWSLNNMELWTKGHMGPFPARNSQLKNSYFTNDKFRRAFAKVIPLSVPQNYPAKNVFPSFSAIEGEYPIANALQVALTTNKDTKTILLEENKVIEDIIKGN